MARKPGNQKKGATSRKTAVKSPARRGQKEILYDRITGRSEEVTVRSPTARHDRHRTTFTLHHSQRVRLDELCARIRQQTGAKVSPSMVVRGMLDGLSQGSLDLTECMSEADVRNAVRRRLASR